MTSSYWIIALVDFSSILCWVWVFALTGTSHRCSPSSQHLQIVLIWRTTRLRTSECRRMNVCKRLQMNVCKWVPASECLRMPTSECLQVNLYKWMPTSESLQVNAYFSGKPPFPEHPRRSSKQSIAAHDSTSKKFLRLKIQKKNQFLKTSFSSFSLPAGESLREFRRSSESSPIVSNLQLCSPIFRNSPIWIGLALAKSEVILLKSFRPSGSVCSRSLKVKRQFSKRNRPKFRPKCELARRFSANYFRYQFN